MESTSEAMRIQVSHATHSLLTQLGGFRLEERGEIDVKVSRARNAAQSTRISDNPIPKRAPLAPALLHQSLVATHRSNRTPASCRMSLLLTVFVGFQGKGRMKTYFLESRDVT